MSRNGAGVCERAPLRCPVLVAHDGPSPWDVRCVQSGHLKAIRCRAVRVAVNPTFRKNLKCAHLHAPVRDLHRPTSGRCGLSRTHMIGLGLAV